MLRHIVTVSTGTALSRLAGFVRDVLTAALLGATPVADAYLAAFQFVTVARRIATEGALNAALVPAWLGLRQREGAVAAAAFAGRMLGTLGLLTVAAAALLGLALPAVLALLAPGFDSERLALASAVARLMLPYFAVVGPVAVLLGLLNARRAFALAAFVPLLLNLALLAALAVLLLRGQDAETAALALAATVGAAGFLQLIVLGVRTRGEAAPLRLAFDAPMRRFIAAAVPGAVASAMPQLLMLAGIAVASGAPAAVAWLYFASRLIELPLGLVGVAIGTVLVSELSHANRDEAAFAQAERQGLVLAVGLSLPAAAGLWVLAGPLVLVLFQHGAFTAADAGPTAQALAMLALGLPAQVAFKALSAAFFARGDTRTPFLATLAALAVGLGGALALAPGYGIAGIALALSLAAWGAVAWLWWRRRGAAAALRDGAIHDALARIVVATLAMAAALGAVLALWPPPAARGAAALQLVTLIVGGIALYGGLLHVFGVLDGAAATALRSAMARGKDGASNERWE